jgi:hypothetical protein
MRVFLPQVEALFGLVGDVQQHQPRDVELRRALGHHELHRLAVGQLLAEGLALGDVRRREIKRALRHSDVVHAVAQAAIGEPVLAHAKAIAFAAEQIVRRHDKVLDFDFGMAAAEDVRQLALADIVLMSRMIR